MSRELADSDAFCARVASREAKNFYPSFLLLPTGRRRSMYALYAFMRRTDDIADEPGAFEAKRDGLGAWRGALDLVLNGAPASDRWPGWPALADAIARHALPGKYLHDVINGVAMDLEPRAFETFEELRAYCRLVASAVGLCCLHIWGYRSDGGRAEALAEACGIALQLTNIVRDVREDALNGRVYLPQEDLRAFGVASDDLLAPSAGPPLRRLLKFEARRAYDDYDRSSGLAALVDPAGRPMLRAIVATYRTLLDEIVRRDCDVLSARVSIPAWQKALIVFRAYASRDATEPAADVHPFQGPTR